LRVTRLPELPLALPLRRGSLSLLDKFIPMAFHTLSTGRLRGFQKEALEGVIFGVNFLSTLVPREFLFGFQLPGRDRQARATASQQAQQGWDYEPTDKRGIHLRACGNS